VFPYVARDIIFSGGSDKRFLSWSLTKGTLESERKFESRVSVIKANPMDPELVLVW